MKQLILSVPENKYNFFLELIKTLRFVKVSDEKEIKLTAKQKEFVKDLKHSLHEVELHQQGKIRLKTLDELLNEL